MMKVTGMDVFHRSLREGATNSMSARIESVRASTTGLLHPTAYGATYNVPCRRVSSFDILSAKEMVLELN